MARSRKKPPTGTGDQSTVGNSGDSHKDVCCRPAIGAGVEPGIGVGTAALPTKNDICPNNLPVSTDAASES